MPTREIRRDKQRLNRKERERKLGMRKRNENETLRAFSMAELAGPVRHPNRKRKREIKDVAQNEK
jgi:hypothetical protein